MRPRIIQKEMPNQSANIINNYDFFYKVEDLCRSYHKGETLVNRLKHIYIDYEKYVQDKSLRYDNKVEVSFPSKKEFDNVGKIILEIAKDFEQGKVNESYNKFNKLWDIEEIQPALNMKERGKDAFSYYRGRLKSSEPIKYAKDLFHVPFEKRHLVSTARFSMPGYPCLYLTRRIYTIWKELPNCRLEDLCVSRLRYQYRKDENNPLCLLDLRLRCQFYYNLKDEDLQTALKAYLLIMPLIIACSLRVQHQEAPYKQEYVIPQIVMHSVIERMCTEKKCYGIIYSSTNDDHSFWHEAITPPNIDCIVIPVQTLSNKGYCSELTKKFWITEPMLFDTQWYTIQMNGKNAYQKSIFWQFEEALKNKNLEQI